MTRFWLSLEQGVRFVIRCIEEMQGGEVFVPKLPSTSITDLAESVAPDAKIEEIGIRPGEKLHEVLISEDEARSTLELEDMYVIQPAQGPWFVHTWEELGHTLKDGFRYASDSNPEKMSTTEIAEMVAPIEAELKAEA